MASSSSISSESDENNAFKTAWEVMFEKCISGPNEEKMGLLVRLWKSLEKEINCGRGRKNYHRDCLNNLLKLTLSRSIECDWPVDSSETDMIYSSLEVLGSIASGLKEAKAIEHVKISVKTPWNNEKMVAFMADSAKDKGITTEMLINYMNQDGLDICSRRLEVLRETGYDKVVFNVANYYVKSLRVPSFMASLVESTHLSDVVNIFVIWITLSFKLKDTGHLYSTLKSVPFLVVYETLHRLRVQLNNSKDESVSIDTSLVKVFDRAYHDVLICAMDDLFTRKKPPGLVSKFGDRVSSLWVEHFENDIAKIKKETDIYVKDSTNSELMYSLGSQLYEKIGKSILEISLTLIITGIIADLNSHLESAEETNSKNRRLSQAFILLSKMISHNLTFRRECILTAFSVYPTQELMDEIINLAKESGFCGTEETTEENAPVDTNSPCVPSVPLRHLIDKFDDMSQDLIASLEKGDYNKASGQAFKSIADKKNRNLDGLLLIQGELLTRSANYNPIDIPVKSLTPEGLGLDSDLTADLVSVVNSPRWHLLSWVMEWPQLHEKCLKLLKTPSIKESVKDLKYLVIDYTQFDDWSSDEEISPMAGVEPGFENWDEVETNDPEQIDEKGLTKEDEESISLNQALETHDEMVCNFIDDGSASDSKRPKIGAPSPEDIQTLINTVPGLLKPEPDLIAPKEPIEMDVRIVQLTRMGPVVDTTSTPTFHLSSGHSASIVEEEPTTEVVIESSSSTESSVDSIANSLISQIQTPVISVPEKQSVIPPRTNIIKIITPNSVNHGSGEIVIKKIQEQPPTPENGGQFDLIRQLNLARSQGLVVLQQWGDKQVLVHKATGRWIMRQGNRLVTVPPQALGINTTAAASPSPSISSSSGSHDMEDDDVPEEKEDEVKNNTMRQLAEFDSILESKFNNVAKPTRVIATTSSSNTPTYVILRSTPQSITTNTASSSVISATSISKKSSVVSGSPRTLTHPSTSKVSTTHGGVIVHNKAGPSSKPQEDPVTLKRIQQILDDYNEQIRKSPDLQNRPAPRRRTLSTQQSEANLISSPPPTPPIVNTMTPEPPPPKQRKVADNSSNNKLLNEVLEPGQVTNGSNVPRAIVRQVVVPSSIAASLQSSKKQLVFLSGNKKIVALKPLIIQQGGVKQAAASGIGGSGLKTILVHQGGILNTTTTTNSGHGGAVSCHLEGIKRSLEEEEEDSIHRIGGMHEMLTPPPSSSSLSPTMLSPPSTILDRPSSPPGFGIPMEMTPGQIMEAEISANISDNPYSPLSQCSSSSNRSESF